MAMDIKIPVAMEPQRVSTPVSTVGVKASMGTASQQPEGVTDQQAVQETRNSEFTPEELESAVRNLNDYVQNVQRNLQFNIDDDSGHTIIKVIDSETEELIRQMPSEEVLAMSRHLREMEEQQGMIFQQEA